MIQNIQYELTNAYKSLLAKSNNGIAILVNVLTSNRIYLQVDVIHTDTLRGYQNSKGYYLLVIPADYQQASLYFTKGNNSEIMGVTIDLSHNLFRRNPRLMPESDIAKYLSTLF